MNARLASLLLLALPAHADPLGLADPRGVDLAAEEKLPAMDMLLQGSILRGVLIPQYDEANQLNSLLRSEKLELVDQDTIAADGVRIEFFNPDRSPRGAIALASARLESQRMLRSTEPVSLESGQLTAKGAGLIYEIRNSRGFLLGPAQVTAFIDQSTAMKSPLRSTLAGATLMAAAAVHGEGLPKLSDAEIASLNELATSRRATAETAAREADEMIAATTTAAAAAELTLGHFLRTASLTALTAQLPALGEKVPDPDPAKLKNPATFSAEDGIYFDSPAGLLILLKNVKMDHPQMTLEGADEVKVFLEQPAPPKSPAGGDPATEKIDEEKAADLFGGGKLGDPVKIAATGTLVVETKGTKERPETIKASGRQMVLDLKTNELIIRGGQPWIVSSKGLIRMNDPQGYFRVNLDTNDFSAVGDSSGSADIPTED